MSPLSSLALRFTRITKVRRHQIHRHSFCQSYCPFYLKTQLHVSFPLFPKDECSVFISFANLYQLSPALDSILSSFSTKMFSYLGLSSFLSLWHILRRTTKPLYPHDYCMVYLFINIYHKTIIFIFCLILFKCFSLRFFILVHLSLLDSFEQCCQKLPNVMQTLQFFVLSDCTWYY